MSVSQDTDKMMQCNLMRHCLVAFRLKTGQCCIWLRVLNGHQMCTHSGKLTLNNLNELIRLLLTFLYILDSYLWHGGIIFTGENKLNLATFNPVICYCTRASLVTSHGGTISRRADFNSKDSSLVSPQMK